VNIDELKYTDKENDIIQQYLKKKAMTERFDRDGDGRIKCDITNPMNLWRQKHSTNNCGSVRLRTAPAELALAIIMQDEELWAKGLWDLDYTLSMIEEEGYFVPLSARGCKALGYSWDTSKLFSLNLEMLQLAGFNLLDYRTRHGKTVAEAYEMLFKQYEDITISNHIAKKGFGANSCGIKPYKTHNEFFAQEFGVEVKKVDEIIQDNIARGNKARIVVPIYDDYINWSIRFVAEKHPEWIEDKKSLQEIKVHPWLSQYYHVQPFEIYNANALSDNFNIWLKKNKIANIEAKKEKTKCASSELNGEYKVTWIFHNINGGYDPEIQGSEKLVIENCIGKFEGVKNFQPSAELRENLEVTLKSDGHIDIRGDLDLFEPGRSYFTSLEGNVSSGEITGVWEEGDLIKIKLSKKPKISKLAEKKNSSCEDGSNGEYIASWFAASTKDDVGWEFVGTEKITFDDCEGKFEAAEDFQPEDWFKMSKALRKDLNVYIKPDGSIVISGDLDLDYSETQRININGKISSGEVLGYFNTGWQLKVELKKK
jgi:hypothetical protein